MHLRPPSPRRFSRWVALHAWKLAGLTAIVTFVGVFIAVSLNLLLRPTRIYFFPLIADVSKYQPEAAILRTAFVAATALLFSTAIASLLHCQSLRLFARERIVDAHDEFQPSPHHVKRRVLRFSSIQLIIFLPLTFTVLATFLQYSGLALFLYNTIDRHVLLKIALYITSIIWAIAMLFLIWYFFQLQHIPDRDSFTDSLPSSDVSPSSSDSPPEELSTPSIYHRLRALLAWSIAILRPICLTGQAVCLIKIVGLWLALDTFSIANIRLVKITLLAALAFSEYTAAFFFAFFMTILAVDMRSKAAPPEIIAAQPSSPSFLTIHSV